MSLKDTAVFTVCSISFLPRALVLAESVFRYDGIKTKIYLIDKKNSIVESEVFADIYWIEDEQIPRFNEMAFRYDVTEFSTAVKPIIAGKLLGSFSKVVFLDPDIRTYFSLGDIVSELDSHPILLTPHYCTPKDCIEEDYDLAMMRFGSFNLGFFAVSSAIEAIRFLDWWAERCIDFCYFETQFGLSTDQKWVSIAPCFFPNLKIIFNPGYNMAFWNLHERFLSKDAMGYTVNSSFRLLFFHFSSFNKDAPRSISKRKHKWQQNGRDDLVEICEDYAKALKQYDKGYSKMQYAFDYLDNGWYVSPTLRRAYAAVYNKLGSFNPFDSTGPIINFIQKNHLRQRDNNSYTPAGKKDVTAHSLKFALVNKILRIILVFVGPNSFSNVSRLFVFLSSYRQNDSLWKIE